MNAILDFVDLNQISTLVIAFVPRLLTALLIGFAFWLVFRLTRTPLTTVLVRSGLEPNLVRLLVDNIYRAAVFVFGIVMAASQLGINVGAALAGIGVAGLALGIAAQDSLANTIAGLTIFWDEPFKVRDWVSVCGQYGEVIEITLRSTRIQTPSNTWVVIPNRKIVDDVLVNHTKNGETRVNVPIGIAYKEDIPRAREVLLAAAKSVAGLMENPAPAVAVVKLDDSSVNLELRVWIGDAAAEAGIFVAMLEAGKLALDRAGVQIPYPHLQLFVDAIESGVLEDVARLPQLAAKGGASS